MGPVARLKCSHSPFVPASALKATQARGRQGSKKMRPCNSARHDRKFFFSLFELAAPFSMIPGMRGHMVACYGNCVAPDAQISQWPRTPSIGRSNFGIWHNLWREKREIYNELGAIIVSSEPRAALQCPAHVLPGASTTDRRCFPTMLKKVLQGPFKIKS